MQLLCTTRSSSHAAGCSQGDAWVQQCPLLPLPACRYPLIVKDVIEEEPRDNGNGEEVPVNTAEPNPNGVELDNLYLVSLSLICSICWEPFGQKAMHSSVSILLGMLACRQLLPSVCGVHMQALEFWSSDKHPRNASWLTAASVPCCRI